MFTGNRIINPVKPVVNTALTTRYAKYVPILESNPGLVKVIEQWADLPDVTKGLILAAVKTPS